MRTELGWWVLALVVLTPLESYAGDPGAEALFQDGKAALDRGAFDEACPRLADSNKLEPLAGTSYFLGDCEEKRGRIATAWAAFLEARQRMDPADERLALVEERINKLAGRLPKLVVRLAPDIPDSAKMFRGDTEVGRGSIGVSLPVDPGLHVLRVEAEGFEPRAVEINAVEAETVSVTLELGPVVKTPTAAPKLEPTSPVPLIVGGLLAGLGAVGMGAGIGMGFAASGDYDAAAGECASGACSQSGFDARTDARALGDAATGVFIGGGVLAAAGLTTIIIAAVTGPDAPPPDESKQAWTFWVTEQGIAAGWSQSW